MIDDATRKARDAYEREIDSLPPDSDAGYDAAQVQALASLSIARSLARIALLRECGMGPEEIARCEKMPPPPPIEPSKDWRA